MANNKAEHSPNYSQPTIHTNGSDPKTMLDDAQMAAHGLDKAAKAFRLCAPHGRDYYTQKPGALEAATKEYRSHLTNMLQARDYLVKLAEHIQNRGPRNRKL